MAGEKMIPSWLKCYLSDLDAAEIERAVTRAETKTSAEIVPMIVRRSSTIGHLPFTIFLLLSFAIFVVSWPFHDWVDAHGGDYWLPLLLMIALGAAFPLAKLAWLQRLLIPDVDEDFQARQRAWAEFISARMSQKKDRRGVLFFVSLMERKAVILIDEGLKSIWTPEELEHQAAEFGRRLHDQSWGSAFEESIDEIGEKLGKALPREAGSRDELGNFLIIKE